MLRPAVYFVSGVVFGGFLTVVVHRVPRGESLIRPRSRCPDCRTQLRARDNVPVVSYLVLRGRCRSCGHRISPAYPLTELVSGALFAGAALRFEQELVAGLMACFLALVAALAVIDIRHRIIPNRVVYPALALAAAVILAGWALHGGLDAPRAGLGFLLYGGGLLLVAFVSPAGMGMGDVKLAALIGLVLGALGLAHVGVAAGVGIALGGVGAILALILGRAGRKSAMPFGPFLAAGAVVAAFAGWEIASAYLSLFPQRPA